MEERVYYTSLQLSSHTLPPREIRARTHSRNPKARTEAEAMEEHSLLVCSPWLLMRLSYTTQDHPPTVGIIHQENALWADMMEALFSAGISSSQIAPACGKLAKKLTAQLPRWTHLASGEGFSFPRLVLLAFQSSCQNYDLCPEG